MQPIEELILQRVSIEMDGEIVITGILHRSLTAGKLVVVSQDNSRFVFSEKDYIDESVLPALNDAPAFWQFCFEDSTHGSDANLRQGHPPNKPRNTSPTP